MPYTQAQFADLLHKEIISFDRRETLICDGNCRKAWGINNRPRVILTEGDPDDYYFIPDGELCDAPDDPGTYRGGHAKPSAEAGSNRLNKWCSRECERSIALGEGEEFRRPKDFSNRVFNRHSRQREADQAID
jgi:hypothetical protein